MIDKPCDNWARLSVVSLFSGSVNCMEFSVVVAVRRDSLIRGIKISDNECKISQYADDTTLILDGTRSSIERSFVLLNIFAKL